MLELFTFFNLTDSYLHANCDVENKRQIYIVCLQYKKANLTLCKT
jgi:hypothetical protein